MSTRPDAWSSANRREYARLKVSRNTLCSAPSVLSTERAAPKRALNLLQYSYERRCFAPSRWTKRLASGPASTVNRRLITRMRNTGPSSR